MRILVTAFDPFGGESVNPALEAVKALPDTIADATVIKVEIPTVFGASIDKVVAAIEEYRPTVVLNVGQAGGRFSVTPERVAINIDDARIQDNEGNQPIDVPVVEGGPLAYFSTLPVKAIVRAIRDDGLPCTLSNSAGTFVCNHVMYGTLHHLASTGDRVRAGFIHVPFIPDQVLDKPNMPSMSPSDITRSLKAAIRAIVASKDDIQMIAGETH